MKRRKKEGKPRKLLQLPLEQKIYFLGYNSWNSSALHGDSVGVLGGCFAFLSNQSKLYLPTVSFIQVFQYVLGPCKAQYC